MVLRALSGLQPNAVTSMRYPIGATGQVLVIPAHVIEHFDTHRQRRWHHREGGGQLFSRLEGADIVVDRVTGPRPCDWRTRTSYRPNRAAERREIGSQFKEGYHFIGDWHTHPEHQPSPSQTDLRSIADCVQRSVHDLNAFVLVIVGLAPWPRGLHVSVHDGTHVVVLGEADAVGVARPLGP